MNEFEKYADSLIQSDLEFIKSEAQPYLQLIKEYNDVLQALQDATDRCKRSGEKLTAEEVTKILYGTNNLSNTKQASKRDSLKENVQPAKELTPPVTSGRPKRNAFQKASESIYKQTNQNNGTKMRREGNANVFIKPEKLSMGESTEITSNEINARVKQETEEMPAPKRLPPRKKKQKEPQTDIEIKQEKLDEFEKNCIDSMGRRDSDVILQDLPVPVIDISEDEEQMHQIKTKTTKSPPVSARVTRTKTRAKNNESSKRMRVDSFTDNSEKPEKRSKSSIEPEKEDVNNATFVKYNDKNSQVVETTKTVPAALNVTVVLDKQKSVPADFPSDLMTDDESGGENQQKPSVVKKNVPHNHGLIKSSKQVFSPFDQSPVKKKVEAFEKLGAAADIPPRQTRTKTRAQAKEQDATDNPNPPVEKQPTSMVKERAKLFTPVASKFIPKSCSTSKANKGYLSQIENSSMNIKSTSGVKAPKHDFLEREKLRKETDRDALRKRELQAQMEEKRRKREEKQLKAQQQREVLEKEKLKLIEQQKLRDEKHKQMLAEQEERKQKQREELERKRLQAKRKAIEEKKREEEKRLEEQRKLDEINAKLMKQEAQIAKQLLQSQKKQRAQQQVPIYKTTKAPRLPTHDCYDSEEEEYPDSRHARNQPKWTRGNDLKIMQTCMQYAGEKIKNTYFSRQAITPDLEEIFEVIDPRLLKRNSSAIWHKAPKYSLMPTFDSHIEYSEEDE